MKHEAIKRILFGLFIAILIFCAQVRFEGSDSKYNILTASAILEDKTLYIDKYCKEIACDNNFRIFKIEDHYLYGFPLGSALFSLPIVAMTKVIGLNPIKKEVYIQRFIIFLCLIAIYFTMLKIGDHYLNDKQSTFLSSIFFFCTGLISTLASALWSHDLAILFCFLALLCLIRDANFFLISFLLFASYICRPTFCLFALSAVFYLLLIDWKKAIYVIVSLLFFLCLFFILCFKFYHAILAPYYLPTYLSNPNFMLALYGHLFSPSRGLITFSPFIFIFLFICDWKKTLNKFTLALGILWPILHLIMVSRFIVWWGGYSFGPRLMVDCLPGIFIFMLNAWRKNNSKNIFFLAAILFSFYIHSYKGRWDIDSAVNWNKTYLTLENQDNTSVLFDWKKSQLLN